MKRHKSIVDSRRNRIYQALQESGTVKVDELAATLEVSPLTIRRDLEYFEAKKLVERFYGGAMLVNKFVVKDNTSQNNALAKHAIAKKAAEFVETGDTLFVNTSSTALLVLKYIRNKRVVIITNNGKAIFADKDPMIQVVLTGGELREPKEAMVGEFAINNLSRVTATKSFLGCSGMTPETGITTAVLQEVAVNEMMLNRCVGPRIIVADSSKIGRDHSFVSGSIDKCTILITDNNADPQVVAAIKANGVSVIQVEPLRSIE
ncbi:MAG TPA: DeoR/GlpR transcriptional regulator [Erysipelotrichaceae bacterium]|nr:MAG: ArsR family transcriptional regulator [Firmicutes bacterium GWE2_51_13]HAM62200.1 DeoR/GlpR transcriptional regulator [Erysipelotrichaceae bacterium]HBZ40886.1 DeoR/GlpR transcriptional regulator [Erysipelotrichaceae bacterium]